MIVSDVYRDEYDRLIHDPLLQELANEVRYGIARGELTTSDLGEYDFMARASDEFQRRGGKADSIGGAGEAIRATVDPEYTSPFKRS